MWVRDWIGDPNIGQPINELAPHNAKVSVEICEPKRDSFLTSKDDVDVRWASALDTFELLGVFAELDHCIGTNVPRELGVFGLVGESAKVAWVIDSAQEIGMASPCDAITCYVEEGCLIDALWSRTEGVERQFNTFWERLIVVNIGDIETLLTK